MINLEKKIVKKINSLQPKYLLKSVRYHTQFRYNYLLLTHLEDKIALLNEELKNSINNEITQEEQKKHAKIVRNYQQYQSSGLITLAFGTISLLAGNFTSFLSTGFILLSLTHLFFNIKTIHHLRKTCLLVVDAYDSKQCKIYIDNLDNSAKLLFGWFLTSFLFLINYLSYQKKMSIILHEFKVKD